MSAQHDDQDHRVQSFPPFFGVRRELQCPPLERIDFAARDGSALCLHHTSGGNRGPVLITPGTAMTALSYCIDSVPCNLVEFLVGEGFDVWLFDWRTSPLLAAHERPYTTDDVARYDWPTAIEEVRHRTGQDQVTVLAHCLSAPCLMLSLLRGYTPLEHVRAFVASQVALHPRMTRVGTIKVQTHLDRLLPSGDMVHQKRSDVSGQIADISVSFLALVLPTTYECKNSACYRQGATFGEVILHDRVNAVTHAMMGDLIPKCQVAFLKDFATYVRRGTVLTDDDAQHLERLKLPILLISGSENRMFVPESTELSYNMLCQANGADHYERIVFEDFGHLDCFIGDDAIKEVWPSIARKLG